jgi:hypothetical protein
MTYSVIYLFPVVIGVVKLFDFSMIIYQIKQQNAHSTKDKPMTFTLE